MRDYCTRIHAQIENLQRDIRTIREDKATTEALLTTSTAAIDRLNVQMSGCRQKARENNEKLAASAHALENKTAKIVNLETVAKKLRKDLRESKAECSRLKRSHATDIRKLTKSRDATLAKLSKLEEAEEGKRDQEAIPAGEDSELSDLDEGCHTASITQADVHSCPAQPSETPVSRKRALPARRASEAGKQAKTESS